MKLIYIELFFRRGLQPRLSLRTGPRLSRRFVLPYGSLKVYGGRQRKIIGSWVNIKFLYLLVDRENKFI